MAQEMSHFRRPCVLLEEHAYMADRLWIGPASCRAMQHGEGNA